MFNLLIADDEELERRAVKKVITNNFENVINIYEAKNGREAIEIGLNVNPDIVIADIKMPGINGLEAIKELKKSLNYTYFIILTAYDYFAYAKEAITNDVKDYMLKPFKKDELIKRINKAIEMLEEQKRNRTVEIELREKIYAMLPALENELVYAIISDNLKNIDYNAYLGYLNINFDGGYCMIIRGDDEVKGKVKNYLEGFIKPNYNAVISSMFTNDIVMFIQSSSDLDEYTMKLEAVAFARKIADVIRKKFDVSIKVGIGKNYSSMERLSKSYKEALNALEFGEGDIKHYDDIKFSPDFNSKILEPAIDKKSNSDYDELLIKAKEFIEKNFNKDITLEETASYVGVSSYYFSKIFKALVGKNYMDYVTDLRIEKAKDMMENTSESIKEICYEVGYNDPNYFSRVFKKIEGVTPSEYKSRL